MDQTKSTVEPLLATSSWRRQRRSELRLYDTLLAVQLNDQLLVDRQLNIFTLRQRKDPRRISVAIHFQPVGQRAMAGEFLGHFEDDQFLAVLADGNFLPRPPSVRNNIDLPIIDRPFTVTHPL